MPPLIFVTGGAGYIGSHCVKELEKEGYDVLAFDNLSEGHRGMVLADEFIEGELADKKLLGELFEKYPVEAVIHLAANCKVAESVEDPEKYYKNNVEAGMGLLQAMSEAGIRDLVFSSSAAVYGAPGQIPIPEDHSKEPENPYGWTKWIFERILEDYTAAYDIRAVSLRYFNAAGSDPSGEIGELHQPETHLIPIVLQAASGERDHVKIFGTDYDTADGTCIRDFIHVTDLAKAHLSALEEGLGGVDGHRPFNLGLGKGYSVKQVIETCRRVTGERIVAKDWQRRPGDPPRLVADPTRAEKELGWEPEISSLEEIVSTAWKWHCSEKRKRHI